MRRWLAALALVPVMAWGDCMSVDERAAFTDMALAITDRHEEGVPERELLTAAHDMGDPAIKAAFYEGVRLVYSPMPATLSTVVSLMQAACRQEAR